MPAKITFLKSCFKMKSILLLLLLLTFTVNSATNISNLKDSLSKHSSNVFKIGIKIKGIESKLGRQNDVYISQLQLIKELENHIIEIKSDLEKHSLEIANKFNQTKKNYELLLMESDGIDSDSDLLRKELLKKTLVKNLAKIKNSNKSNTELLRLLRVQEDKLADLRSTEDSLYSLIIDLEEKKRRLSKTYLDRVEEKNDLEKKIEDEIALSDSKKIELPININFPVSLGLPLNSFLSFKSSKKGVTFKFNKVEPVVATEAGDIAYSGELASYGKVIILDHGKGIRSVILGNFNSKVRKGDKVVKGDLLGYTETDKGITKSLYYEIRKKNIAQNTIQWLEKYNKSRLKI